jgi:hypothetical protein
MRFFGEIPRYFWNKKSPAIKIRLGRQSSVGRFGFEAGAFLSISQTWRYTMKNTKKWWFLPIALLAVTGLLMVGCGGGSNNPPPPPPGGWENDLSGVTVTLITNTYSSTAASSTGLQGKITDAELFAGEKILAGDMYKLEVTFTVDKALSKDLQFGLVDTSGAASYWRPLTWNDADDDMPVFAEASELGTADTEITLELELIALKAATSADVGANAMVFECADAWSLDPVTITFSKFIFSKLDNTAEVPCTCDGDATACECGDDCDCEECEEPEVTGDPDFALGTGTGLIVKIDDVAQAAVTLTPVVANDASGSPYEDPIVYFDNNTGYKSYTTGYGNAYAYFTIDLGSKNLANFSEIKFDIEGIDGGYTYKQVGVWAGLEVPSGHKDLNTGDGVFSTVQLSLQAKTAIAIPLSGASAELTGSVYFVLGAHAGTAVYKISNIELIPVPEGYTAVENITGVPVSGLVGEEITLGGTVAPGYATNQTIVWSIKTDGGTESTITDGILTAEAAGTVTVTATIANGATESTPFTKDFEITIIDGFANATRVTLDATNKNIGFAGLDGNNDKEAFVSAKFLIFAFTEGWGGGSPDDGFGGMQLALQGNNGSGWDLYAKGWTSFDNDGSQLVYWVVPISEFETFDSVVEADGNMKIVLNYGVDTSKIAGIWLTSVELEPDEDGGDVLVDFYHQDNDNNKIDGTSIEPCWFTFNPGPGL